MHDPFIGKGHTEAVGLLCIYGLWSCECTSSAPQARGVSPCLPPPSQKPWSFLESVCRSASVWNLSFCWFQALRFSAARERIHPKPTQLQSHSMTWDCKHSSSPGWHTLAFPTYTKVSSQASKEPLCDNARSGQSGCSNFTSSDLFLDPSDQALLSGKIIPIRSLTPAFQESKSIFHE